MSRSRRLSPAVPRLPEKSVARTGVRRVVVIRESDAANRLLFLEMIFKTVMAFRERIPGVERLVEIGLGPFEDPARFQAEIVGSSKARTALFMLDASTLVMYHMGSAALDDSEDAAVDRSMVGGEVADRTAKQRNCFTARLIGVLEQHRPEAVFVYAINRLVRDFGNASRLQIALKALSVTVQAGDRGYDLNETADILMWQVLTSFAAAERDGIVDRNLIGRIAQARRNEWPHGHQHIPFGYVRNGRSVSADESKRDAVRTVLELLADLDLTAAEFVSKAAEVGMSRPRLRRIHNDETAMVDVALHPKDVRRSVETWLELYETGTYKIHLPCPSPVGDIFGGLPVWVADHDSAGDGRRMVTLSYTFGVPEGGWAPPSLFEAIRSQAERNAAYSRVVTRGDRRPFSGRDPYPAADGTLLQLDSQTADGYRLRSVELEPIVIEHSTRATTRQSNAIRNAKTLATFALTALHRAVADGIVDAISSAVGVDGQLVASSYLPVVNEHDEHRRLLETRIERLRDESRRAAHNAARLELSSAQQPFIDTAEALARQVELAEAELRALSDSAPGDDGLVRFVSSDELARILARVAAATGAVEGAFADALSAVLPRVEVHPTCNPTEFRWLTTVRIPAPGDRYLELGPITGLISPRSVRKGTSMRPPVHPSHAVVSAWTRGVSLQDLATARGSNLQTILDHVQEALVRGGFRRETAFELRRCRPPELRQLAIAAADVQLPGWIAREEPDLDAIIRRCVDDGIIPEGCNPRWAGHTLLTYHRHMPTLGPAMWDHSSEHVAAALASVIAGADTLTGISTAMHSIDGIHRRPRTVVALLSRRVAPLERIQPWIEHESGLVSPENRYAPLLCPCCRQPMTVYLDVPEVTGATLCATCRVGRTTHSPVYPESYVTEPPHVAVTADQVPRQRRGMSQQTATKAVERYRNGAPVLTICAELDIPSTQLYDALEQLGIERRHPYRRRSRAAE